MANPAAEARAKVLSAHPQATVWQRRRNTIKHRLADAPDGRRRYALDAFIGPIHYGPGGDQEIDTAFEPSTAPWSWEMTRADFEVRALSQLDAGQVVEYRDGEEWVRFQPMALQYSNALDQIQPIAMPGRVDAAVDDDTLAWADGYGPGIDISWQVQTARLAKRLTVETPDALPPAEQYILDGGEPCLEINFVFAYSKGVTPWINGEPWDGKKQAETQGLVEFRDGEGNVLWWFNLPRSWDADRKGQLGTFRFKKVGNALYVSHRVPLGFVQAAIYPLVLDVDVDKQVAAGEDDAYETDAGTDFNRTDTDLYMDSSTNAAFRYNSGMRFTSVAIPQAATIDAATLELYVFGTLWDDANFDLLAEAVDDAVDFATTQDVTSRARTSASAPWVESALGIGWHTSPDFKAAIQEVVDRGSWSTGNDLVVFGDGKADLTRYLGVRSYEGNSGEAPKLHIEYTSGAAPQTLSPSGIASAEAFGGLKVNLKVEPSAVASAEAFGTPKANLNLAPSAIASAEAFGGPQLNFRLAPSGIASLEVFGAHTLAPGAVTLLPSGIASLEVFGTAKLSARIAPTGIASLEAFGTAVLLPGPVTLLPSAIASAEGFGTATILRGAVILQPSGIASEEAFGTPRLIFIIAPASIPSGEAFGTATLVPGAVIIVVTGIPSAEAFGLATVGLVEIEVRLIEVILRGCVSLHELVSALAWLSALDPSGFQAPHIPPSVPSGYVKDPDGRKLWDMH